MSKRKFSAEFKVRFVLEGLKSPDGVAAHCRRQGISEQQFYKWQQQMLSNADALFEQVPQKAARKIQTLEEEIKRKDSIIAEVTEEALELKKKLIS